MNKMKILIILFLFSSAQAGMDHRIRYNDFRMPNIVCPFFYKNNKWISQGAWHGYWGHLVNISAVFRENHGGYALCTTQYYNENTNETLVKFINYFSDIPFEVEPTSCEIEAAYKFKIIKAYKGPASRGHSYEMTSEVYDPISPTKQIKMISYFPTEAEETAWVKELGLAEKRCLNLFPGSVPWEP